MSRIVIVILIYHRHKPVDRTSRNRVNKVRKHLLKANFARCTVLNIIHLNLPDCIEIVFYIKIICNVLINKQGVSKRALNAILNFTVRRVLRKPLHLKTYKLSIFQGSRFPDTSHTETLEYHCEDLFETPCIFHIGNHIEP
jgi:hypothetical protein